MSNDRTTIDRRSFLQAGVTGLAAAAASTVPLAASSREAGAENGAPEAAPFELEELSVVELQRRMAGGQETARSLVRKYLARIDALDRKGPALRAVIELNPDAEAIAERLDAERKAKGPRGPLHGIPVLIKDNIATADRMSTTAGSLALEGSIAPKDAFLVARLREAGAVILGKTNLSEWANFRSTHSTSGWSGRGGLCRNPYALDRNTSGSSAGTGGAISANLAAIGIGTETDGSIVSPSNNCGLVGIKPTVGLVSRHGIIPISHTQDTAGPMCRTVADAAVLLSAIVGSDPEDQVTAAATQRGQRDYTTFLDPNGLKGMRIGVPRQSLWGQNLRADTLGAAALDVLKQLGAVIVDPVDLPSSRRFGEAENQVLHYEFKADLNAYLAWLGPKAPAKSLDELIAFNEAHRDREMPYFGQETFYASAKKGPLTSQEYLDALEKCRKLSQAEGIDAVMDTHKLDALVAPTSGPATLTDLVNGDYGPDGCSSYPAVSGCPHITLPMGFSFGLPVGLSFFGRAFTEPTLIRIAFAYEQATKHRKAPRLLKTAVE